MKTEELEGIFRNILSALNDIKYEMVSSNSGERDFDISCLEEHTNQIEKDLNNLFGYS